MKRFKTSTSDGIQQTGGIPFYSKDIEFIQDAWSEVLYALIYGLCNKYGNPELHTQAPLTCQLGNVLMHAGSAGTVSYGGYVMINSKLYYCEPTTEGPVNGYYIATEEVELDESSRTLVNNPEITIKPWIIGKAKITNTASGNTPVSDIPNIYKLMFDLFSSELNKDQPNLRSLTIDSGGERQITTLVDFVHVTTVNQNLTLLLPNTSTPPNKRIVIRFDAGGYEFKFYVKSGEKILFSKEDGHEEMINTTLVFEFLYDNWLLTSKTDM